MSLAELLHRQPDGTTLAAWLKRVPFAAYLDMQAELQGSDILFTLPENEKLIGNPILPAIHGGVVGGFMEQAASLHLIARMERPVIPKTINFSLDYLRPTRYRATLARCELTRQGRQVANVGVTAWQENYDEPCAIARAHFLIPGQD